MRSTRLEVLFLSLLLLIGACSSDPAADPDTGPTPDAAVDVEQADAGMDQGPVPDSGADAEVADLSVDGPPPPPPQLGDVTMFINLGDSIAAGHGVATSYAKLLMANDDQAYPGYAGKDFATKFPGLELKNLAMGGATSVGVINQTKLAPPNPKGNTLVVLSVGGNDIIGNAMALTDAAQTKAVAQTVIDNIKKALAVFDDKSRYPGEVFIVALNVYEMTDGQGTMPADEPVVAICKQLQSLGPLFGTTMVKNFDVYNNTLEAAFAQEGILLVDVHQAFLGHGFNYKDPANPHYHSDDPTLWLQYDCIHPNLAGHLGIRDLVWRRLFGN